MAKCLVRYCKHGAEDRCKIFKFPVFDSERMSALTRTLEFETEPGISDFICSCHFQEGTSDLEDFQDINSDFQSALKEVDEKMKIIEDNERCFIQVHAVSSCINNHEENKSPHSNTTKRMDFIDWEEYFMATALLAAKRSKDPVTQVGACLVNKNNIIVGVGYNGMPNGCDDDSFPWCKSVEKMNSKHTYVCHAELNAVLNSNARDLSDCTLYVALFPCNECAKIIIQARIKKLVYLSDKHAAKIKTIAAKKMFQAAGVDFRQYQPRRSRIILDFHSE